MIRVPSEEKPVVNASLLTANAVSDLSVHVPPLCRSGIKQRTGGMLPELCNSGAATPGFPQNRAEVIALPGTREDRGAIPALLEQLVERDFFSYFPVNLITPCMYFPSGDAGAARERDIPPAVIARDREEYNFLIDGWVSKDMPSDFTEYFDLREEEMGWKRDFNRLVSGMHAVVDCEIIEDIGHTEEGRRLRDEPGSILNLYYAYMLTLSAIRETSAQRYTLMDKRSALLPNKVQSAAASLRAHASSPDFAVWKLRLRTRHLKLIMGCVECNVCKVHGTVLVIGLASTLQARHEV
ncbi:hypothetical protein EMIHUDRAFT_116153 [Emiliania huxleyi CCMP1516]|uniref:Uncharacterized protein n=2 Tax=Emiliania huxleyi TaxID=2903 RepID=A0A0D3JJX1_EMIH1|nr:hypothetical protein EMIHUDRAFT_116153 [Emiliania huxleyi CCMP1516]EOD23806.1 hypothetical protein EMIHUDRAFT_116153 [Emiliania huxleyi CCMP1516]|eukprot:XP_005776235.1 hypothetical protein EMIHUDRAFT_116153 [Emiliania huxleyi CCMP1516]